MTQTAKHTPGPWVCNDECLIYGQVSSDDEPEAPFVADCARECAVGQYTEQEKANTEFIVQACNAHRELLACAKKFERQFGKAIDEEIPINGADAVDFICEFLFEVRNTIAKATI